MTWVGDFKGTPIGLSTFAVIDEKCKEGQVEE